MSKLRQLASDTALYGISSILGRLINYALVPLYARTLPLGTNGIITDLFTWVAFLNIVFTFGLETSYFRQATKQPEQEASIFKTNFSLMATLAICGSAGMLALAWFCGNRLGYDAGLEYITLLAFILLSDTLVAIPMARLRLQRRPKKFVAIRMGNIALNVGLNIIFLVLPPYFPALQTLGNLLGATTYPVVWVLLAQLLSNGIYFSIIPLRRLSGRVWRQASSVATMRYATPIMVMGLAGIANEMLGRKMLPYLLRPGMYGNLTSLEVLGIYGNVYKLSIFMSLVIQAFKMGAEPFFFQQGARADGKAVIATVMSWFVLACVAIWGGISLNLWWLGPLILKRLAYIDALGVVPILLLANLFLGVYYNLSVWFKVTERTNYGYYFGLFGAAITIALNFLFIPLLGYMGSAIATLVCYSAMAVLCYHYGQRFYPVPYRLGIIIGMLLSVGALLVAHQMLQAKFSLFVNLASQGTLLAILAIFGLRLLAQLRATPAAFPTAPPPASSPASPTAPST